jgi:hypothetical protein
MVWSVPISNRFLIGGIERHNGFFLASLHYTEGFIVLGKLYYTEGFIVLGKPSLYRAVFFQPSYKLKASFFIFHNQSKSASWPCVESVMNNQRGQSPIGRMV